MYNAAGQATSITAGPSGAQQTLETYNYDHATALLSYQDVRRGSSTLLTLGYQYFPSGQLSQLSEGGVTVNYDYDKLGRIFDAKASGSDVWSETYSFDAYGNRTSVVASGQAPGGSTIPLDGLAGSPTPPNGLAALAYDPKTNHVTTQGFAYDAAGNQTRVQRLDGSWVRYQYDQAGRLAQVTDNSGKALRQYAYGADGRRLQEIDPSGAVTSYFWDGNQAIAEYTQPNTGTNCAFSKGHAYLGGRILATFVPKNSGEQLYYHHPDRLGTRLITNSTDNTASEQVTLPFGTLIPGRVSDPINPIFTSYDRSAVIGLDYAVNRYYDSKERFTAVDPAEMGAASTSNPQSLNLYSYAGNDPVNGTDPLELTLTNQLYMFPCPASEQSCAGPGAEGSGGWGPGGGVGGWWAGGPSGGGWGAGGEDCKGGHCALLAQTVELRAAIALVSNFDAHGGESPSAAIEYLNMFPSDQLDQIMYGVLASNASPSQYVGEVGELAAGEYQWFNELRIYLAGISGGIGALTGAKVIANPWAAVTVGALMLGLTIGYGLDKAVEFATGGYMAGDAVYFMFNGAPNAQPWGVDLTGYTFYYQNGVYYDPGTKTLGLDLRPDLVSPGSTPP